MDHRLLAIHVLARLHGVNGGLLVPMVGGTDDHGVDVFAGQDLAVVASGENIVAPEFFAARQAAVVAVRGGDQLDAGYLNSCLSVELSLPAGADEGDLDVVVGGDWFGVFFQFGFCGGKNMQTGHKSGCRYGSGSP